nr:hypothetical protein [Tanacetum cinerariifolium]
MPSDIQYSAATQIWGCYRVASRAKGADEELSDGGSLRVIVYRYDGLPMRLVAPPSPDYIPGPKELQTPADEELLDGGSLRVIVYRYDGLPMRLVAPPSPDYIPGPKELQTPPVPQEEDEHEPDEHVLPAEEQPLPPIDSPTAESLGFVVESNPEEDPEEYEDDETEDGLVDYPIDGGDDRDDDDDDSSGDDAVDEDAEEEHLALADSAIVIPIVELVSPPAISLPPEEEVERLLAMPTPLTSPLTSLSLPSVRERLARYGIRNTWVDPAEAVPEIAPMTLGEVSSTDGKTLRVMEDMRREIGDMQAELLAL